MKNRTALMRGTFVLVLATLALAPMLLSQGQVSGNQTAENAVTLTQKAEAQVKREIESFYASAEAMQKVAAANLTMQMEENVSLYNQSVVLLDEAEVALANANYNVSISKAQKALQGFGQALKSINRILLNVGAKTSQGVDAVGVLDAVNRTLEQIAYLRLVLPTNATDQAALLDQAEVLLNVEEAENLILEGNLSVVVENLGQANELLSQVYEYLKLLAEDSNAVRISGYLHEMDQERERIRARIGEAGAQGLNVTEIFEMLGYHNETEFMIALQNMTQNAQGKIGDLEAVMHDLEVISQMVRQLNQTLTQEINRHQNQGGSSGSGNSENGSQGPGNVSGHSNGTTTPDSVGNSGSGTSGSGSGSNSSSGSGTTGEGNGPTHTGTPDTGNSGTSSGPNETGNNSPSGSGPADGGKGAAGPEAIEANAGNSPSGTNGTQDGSDAGKKGK